MVVISISHLLVVVPVNQQGRIRNRDKMMVISLYSQIGRTSVATVHTTWRLKKQPRWIPPLDSFSTETIIHYLIVWILHLFNVKHGMILNIKLFKVPLPATKRVVR